MQARVRFSPSDLGGLGDWEVLSGQSSSPEGWFQVPFALSQEESRKEELRGYCKTKVSEYRQVGSKGQDMGSSW